jgi:hypothetical protein
MPLYNLHISRKDKKILWSKLNHNEKNGSKRLFLNQSSAKKIKARSILITTKNKKYTRLFPEKRRRAVSWL